MRGNRKLKKIYVSNARSNISSYFIVLLRIDNIFQSDSFNDVDPQKSCRQKVVKTLKHFNRIPSLISKDNAAIIPLFWQGFIAGCEATSKELQMGFKKWGADIAQYLGSYWGARQIMFEVWSRKRINAPRDNWVGVVNDWEMNLMLKLIQL